MILAIIGEPTPAQLALAADLQKAGTVAEVHAWVDATSAASVVVPAGATMPVPDGEDPITCAFLHYTTHARTSKVFKLGPGVEPTAEEAQDLLGMSDSTPFAIVGASWAAEAGKGSDWETIAVGRPAPGPLDACIVSEDIVRFLSCRNPVTAREEWGHLTSTSSPKTSGYKTFVSKKQAATVVVKIEKVEPEPPASKPAEKKTAKAAKKVAFETPAVVPEPTPEPVLAPAAEPTPAEPVAEPAVVIEAIATEPAPATPAGPAVAIEATATEPAPATPAEPETAPEPAQPPPPIAPIKTRRGPRRAQVTPLPPVPTAQDDEEWCTPPPPVAAVPGAPTKKA